LDNSTISSKSVLGESIMIHDNKELSEDQWNSNIKKLVEKLNKENVGVWSTGNTEYSRRKLSMDKDGDVISIELKAWGNHVVNKVNMSPALTIGTAKEYVDMPIRRIASKNTNLMISDELIKLILDDVLTQLNIILWRKIDCEKQRIKRHRANFVNWKSALSKIAVVKPQEVNSMMVMGDVLFSETIPEGIRSFAIDSMIKKVIKVSQVRKGTFAEFTKFGISGHEVTTQISIDSVHGRVDVDSKTESSDEMRRRLIAIIDSGMELKSIDVGVDGSIDDIVSLTKKLADGKEIEVQ
jgi:hypothetical protein